MQSSYTRNYIKIYFWQSISLLLNFLSMFIVIPFLSSEPAIYGIYTICISVSIFLVYADFGFIGAGQKYAAEYFAKAERVEEIRVVGFTCFILSIFLFLFSLVFLILSFFPEILIKDLEIGRQSNIASNLLLIVAVFTPVTLLQRLIQMIYGIRLEDYIVQRINIVASSIKILSVILFFRDGQYNVIGYFLFIQIINLLAAIIILRNANTRYNYDFIELFKAIKFDKQVFNKSKNLAFTSLYLTITWIIYYELDPTVIGKLFGSNHVAIYAIGLTVLSFFRSSLGILFSPFNSRFNHFVGLKDNTGLRSFYIQVTIIMAPVVVIPIIAVAMFAPPLILSWVGVEYIDSVNIAQLLVLCNLFAFITYPGGIMLMAKEKQKEIYIINTIIPIVYWCGIFATHYMWGIKSFAFFKFVAFLMSAIAYYFIMIRYVKKTITESLKEIFLPLVLPILFVTISSFFIRDLLPLEKSKINLLVTAMTVGSIILLAFLLQYFISSTWRSQIQKAIKIFIAN